MTLHGRVRTDSARRGLLRDCKPASFNGRSSNRRPGLTTYVTWALVALVLVAPLLTLATPATLAQAAGQVEQVEQKPAPARPPTPSKPQSPSQQADASQEPAGTPIPDEYIVVLKPTPTGA